MQKKLGDILTWFWDAIDISNNINRAQVFLRKVEPGFMTWFYICGFVFLASGMATLAWYFDLDSTIQATSQFRSTVVEAIPSAQMEWGWYLVLVFTLLPTAMEIFSAGFAKEKIAVLQIAVIALCIFDMVTDMPRVGSFLATYDAYFQNMLPGSPQIIQSVVGGITYAITYCLMLFMATFGFEMGTVVLVVSAILLFLREIFGSSGTSSGGNLQSRLGNRG